MPSLIGCFMRDLPYLRQGLIPQEESGLAVDKLNYTGEEHEKLTDADVQELAQALCANDKWVGEVELNSNELSDLAALYLAPVFEKRSCHNITKLKLDGNNFTSKAGEYIGQALASNPDYKLKKLTFQGMSLESIGLTRVVEAANLNKNIRRLNIGILTDDGLAQLAALLRENTSLEELEFQETKDHQKLWTAVGKKAFVETLRDCTVLKKIGIHFNKADLQDDDKEFKSEIKFYTKQKTKMQAQKDNYRRTMRSCEPAQMFEDLADLIENTEEKGN